MLVLISVVAIYMNIFSESTESHELVMNYKKTKFLGYGSSTFSLNVHTIEMATQYKYLGVELTKDLTLRRSEESSERVQQECRDADAKVSLGKDGYKEEAV